MLSLYPLDYEPFKRSVDGELNPFLRWMRRRHYGYRCRAVRRAKPAGGQLVDVGCGTGGFLCELQQGGGWQAMGIDINQRALNVARRQGVQVRCGELGDLGLPTASFDVVTMWEVIEHVLNPWDTLAEIHRILKPNGVLLLSTPNGESWQAQLWGMHWLGWEVPRHLQIFSPQTLRQLLEDAGFEIVRRLSFPMERFYAVESARRWLQAHVSGSTQLIAHRLTPLVGLAAWPVFRLIDRIPSASSIVLEARVVSR
ncbi:MAG: class I SAM-dependent methyltransferase [Anaerolineae bacterium]